MRAKVLQLYAPVDPSAIRRTHYVERGSDWTASPTTSLSGRIASVRKHRDADTSLKQVAKNLGRPASPRPEKLGRCACVGSVLAGPSRGSWAELPCTTFLCCGRDGVLVAHTTSAASIR